MEAPRDFVKRLSSEFPYIRIRWSEKREAWQIEEQVGRGALPPIHIDPFDDNLIRAKDGYWFICEVRPGTKMPCPSCKATLAVPVLEFAEVRCEQCISKGKDGRYPAGYFPLGEMLLEHLRRTDPLRGAIQRLAAEADKANQLILKQKARSLHNLNEDIGKDSFNRMVGIPQFGYTGSSKFIHMDKDIK